MVRRQERWLSPHRVRWPLSFGRVDDLPTGFQFAPYAEGFALQLDGQTVAIACPANDDQGAPWRLALTARTCLPRYVFTATDAGCRRYMVKWAAKWEQEIRAAVAVRLMD